MVCYSSCSRDSLFYEQSTNLVKGVRRPIGHTTRKRETSRIRRTPTATKTPTTTATQLGRWRLMHHDAELNYNYKYNCHTTRKRETSRIRRTPTITTNTTTTPLGRGRLLEYA